MLLRKENLLNGGRGLGHHWQAIRAWPCHVSTSICNDNSICSSQAAILEILQTHSSLSEFTAFAKVVPRSLSVPLQRFTWQNYPVRLSSKIAFMCSLLRKCGTHVPVLPHLYHTYSIVLYLFLGTSVFSHCALHISPAVTSVCPFLLKESGLHLLSTFSYLPLLYNLF